MSCTVLCTHLARLLASGQIGLMKSENNNCLLEMIQRVRERQHQSTLCQDAEEHSHRYEPMMMQCMAQAQILYIE